MRDTPRPPFRPDAQKRAKPSTASAPSPTIRADFCDSRFWELHAGRFLAFANQQLRHHTFRQQNGGLPAEARTADDIVQDAAFQLFSGAKQYPDELSSVTCVFRLIANIVRNLARRRENRTAHDVLTTVPTDIDDTNVIDESRILRATRQISPEDWTIGREEAQRLLPLVPAKCREVIRLRIRKDGISTKEIAQELLMTERQVWNLILRARRSFRRHFNDA
ncbi:MAG TPA: sigma-70 family RNA polymerase sigma factor [Thermoanaerobaculia bacterium]|nr:sigma-70 family RNA polymerase sigma factor [Thermoanaerobaculia bacterium]